MVLLNCCKFKNKGVNTELDTIVNEAINKGLINSQNSAAIKKQLEKLAADKMKSANNSSQALQFGRGLLDKAILDAKREETIANGNFSVNDPSISIPTIKDPLINPDWAPIKNDSPVNSNHNNTKFYNKESNNITLDAINPNEDTISPDKKYKEGTVNILGGKTVTDNEIFNDYGKYLNGSVGCNDHEFILANWIQKGDNPMLIPEKIEKARQVHKEIIMPIAKYYRKKLGYEDNKTICLTNILFAVVSDKTLGKVLKGSPTSRHKLGEAVNFKIVGVEDLQIIEDLRQKRIPDANIGMFARTTGVMVTLPYYIGNQLVENLHLYSDYAYRDRIHFDFL